MKKNIPTATSSLSIWLSYLEKTYNKTIHMELTRVRLVGEYLNILKPAPFVFIVSGTNGKGTTCCVMEKILILSGYRVGVYSSPHLIRYTERVRIQGVELPESDHITSFVKIESTRGSTPLTYFEYGTLSALLLFKKEKIDIAILEVGVGGRLDATGIVDADVAIITNIALDHTNLLGVDRESIGREKAGIFRTNKPAIIGERNIPYSIYSVAKEKGTYLLRCGIDWHYTISDSSWCFIDIYGRLNNLPFPQVPQPNAASALAALRASSLSISEQAIRNGIRDALLPGRFQIVYKSPRVILDVAHNPHAAAYLIKRLASLPKTNQILAVIGMLRDKDIGGILASMKSVVDFWYCAPTLGPRGASMKHLIKYFSQNEIYISIEEAWRAAMSDASPADTILVCGSFYAVSNIMNIINKTDRKVIV